MILRRFISAILLLVLTGVVAGPAIAGGLACTMDGEEDGCCCARDEATKLPNYAAVGCECSSCVCTIEPSQTPQPWCPTTSEVETHPASGAFFAPPRVAPDAGAPLDRPARVPFARGPPGDATPPLYLLYDTFLI